jgi:hypothetical protein
MPLERIIELKPDRATHVDDLAVQFKTLIKEPVQLSAADAAFITSVLAKRASIDCVQQAIELLRFGSGAFRLT